MFDWLWKTAPAPVPPVVPEKPREVMLILRGIHNLLHEEPALEYARRRGYIGRVLDVSGETGVTSIQTRAAVKTIRADPTITALYGFSGGGYNVLHILNSLEFYREQIKLVVVLGAPNNPEKLYEGPWELVYRKDPPNGDHMAGPQYLLQHMG